MGPEKIIGAIGKMTTEQRANTKANAERQRDSGSEKQQADARAVLAEIDRVESLELAARRKLFETQGLQAVIVDSFARKRMTETEEHVVRALLDHPGTTSEGLSKAIGWGAQSWHLHFGTMCFERFAAYIGDPPPGKDQTFYSYALAGCDSDTREWTMKADAVEGFAALGIRGRKAR